MMASNSKKHWNHHTRCEAPRNPQSDTTAYSKLTLAGKGFTKRVQRKLKGKKTRTTRTTIPNNVKASPKESTSVSENGSKKKTIKRRVEGRKRTDEFVAQARSVARKKKNLLHWGNARNTLDQKPGTKKEIKDKLVPFQNHADQAR